MKTLLDSWLLGGWAYPALTFVLTTALKSSVIVLLAWALTLYLRERAALVRLWAWRACLVALASLLAWPFVPMAVDAWRPKVNAGENAEMQVVLKTATRLNVVKDWPKEVRPEIFEPSPRAGFTLDETPVVPLARVRTPWLSRVEQWVLRAWWGIAVVLFGMRVIRAMCGHYWLRRHVEGMWAESGHRLVRGLRSPVVTGGGKAQIWLPIEAEEWSVTKVRAVCLHEMAHHERRDGAWQWFGWGTACALWWNPLCWLAMRCMTAEAELCADESALGHDIAATDYAQVLVEIASGVGERPSSAGVPMLGRSDIQQRVESILRRAGARGEFGKVGRWGIVMLGFAAVVAGGMEVRHASLAKTPAPSNPLTKEEKEWVGRSLAQLETQQARLNCLHVKMKQTWTFAGPKPMSSPEPSVIEAWVDEAGQKSRVEYRPRVIPAAAAAATPWFIRNETAATTGQTGWSYEDDDVSKLRFSADPHSVFFTLWPQCRMPNLIHVLKQMHETGCKNFGGEQNTLLEKNGRMIVDRDKEGEHSRWEVNTKTGGIEFFCTGFPGRGESSTSEWEVTQWWHLQDGTSYPEKWRTSFYSPGHKGMATYENEMRVLQVIPIIRGEMLTQPPPNAAAFVASDGKVVHGEALELKFVNFKGGKPVPDVGVHYEINDGKRQKVVSSPEGVLRIPLPKEEVKSLRLWGMKSDYVMQLVEWRRHGDPLKLPEVYEVKLYPEGKAIGGIVVNEKEEPVAGVEVMVLHRGGATSWDVFTDVHEGGSRTKTDASGHWKLTGYEEDLTGALIFVEHPDHKRVAMDYRSATGQGYEAMQDGTSKVVLKDLEMIEMRGVVSDESGKPVAGCGVTIGKSRWGRFEEPNAKTDAQGRYRVRLQESPTDLMTFEVAGFQPQMHSVTVTEGKTGTLDVKLVKGRLLRLRVVDEAGAAMKGVRVATNYWKKKRTLWFSTVTDAEGRCEWNGAPMDEVLWDFVGEKQVLREFAITAGAEEQTIVFRPAVRFVGTVVDARSGQPVKSFRVTRGDDRSSPNIYWEDESRRSFENGRFSSETWWMCYDHKLRIEAEGYEPFETALFSPKQQVEKVGIKLISEK